MSLANYRCSECETGVHVDFAPGAATETFEGRCPTCDDTRTFELCDGCVVRDGTLFVVDWEES